MNDDEILSTIDTEVSMLRSDTVFSEFLNKVRPKKAELEDKGWVTINNSFLLRENKGTRKSNLYLALRYSQLVSDKKVDLFVANNISQNNDFDLRMNLDENGLLPLDETFIRKELAKFGFISFVFIGKLEPMKEIKSERIDGITVILDTEFEKEIGLDKDGNIRIGQIPTIKVLKEFIEKNLQHALPEKLDKFEQQLVNAIKKFESAIYHTVKIPESVEELSSTDSIVSKLHNGFKDGLDNYQKSLNQWKSSKSQASYNDLLRIAYVFADEIQTFNTILQRICDLKPLVNFLTFAHQFSLSNIFMKLKLPNTSQKASLSNYRELIAQTRNATFHHLVPIDTRIEVKFGKHFVKPTRLILFDEFKNNTNKIGKGLDYEDKEIFELLQSFSRSSENSFEITFWDENITIMQEAIALIARFEEALNILFRQMHSP